MAQNQITSHSVYLISNMYPSEDNPGYGIFVKNVQEGLCQYGYKTKYLSVIRGKGGNIIDKLYKYLRFYLSILFNYFRKYDLLYVHYPTHSSLILLMLMRIWKRRLVINYHGEDLIYDNTSFYVSLLGRKAESLTKKYASLVIVPSDYYKNIVLKRSLMSEDKIIVSPSGGIDSTIFKEENPIKHDELILGFVGRLQEDKGILDYIQACKKLSNKYNLKAFIIGYGPLAETVNSLVENDSSFIYICGVNQIDLPIYYRKFDLFCFPSKRNTESLGLVGIEAMACGTPVVGTNIGGIPSYLEDRKNGFLISVNDIEIGLIKAVEEYSSFDDNAKSNMIGYAIKSSKRFCRETVCMELSHAFDNLYN